MIGVRFFPYMRGDGQSESHPLWLLIWSHEIEGVALLLILLLLLRRHTATHTHSHSWVHLLLLASHSHHILLAANHWAKWILALHGHLICHEWVLTSHHGLLLLLLHEWIHSHHLLLLHHRCLILVLHRLCHHVCHVVLLLLLSSLEGRDVWNEPTKNKLVN